MAIHRTLLLSALLLIAVTAEAANQKIYWRDQLNDDIRSANLDGTGAAVVIPSGLSSGNAVAVDDIGGKLYFASSGTTHRIHCSDLVGGNVQNLVAATQAVSVTSIDIDPIAREIYWVDNGFTSPNTVIRKANLDGTAPVTLVNLGIAGIGELRLDVAAGKMYWNNYTPNDQIYEANLNGTGVLALAANGASARGLALDPGAGKIYWTDLGTGQVRRVNSDGSSPQTLAATTGWYGIDVDSTPGKLYWASLNTIRKSNLDGTGAFDLLSTPVGEARELDIALCTLAPLVTTPASGCDILVCPKADGSFLVACTPTATIVNGVCDPVAGIPASSIHLESYVPGDLVVCPNPTDADAPTNAQGQTTLSAPMAAGGYTGRVNGDPACGGGLRVIESGAVVAAPPIQIVVRSPDYNGDLVVDSLDQNNFLNVDVAAFISSSTLNCRSDFNPDGILNILDIGIFAFHSGHACGP